MKIFAALMVAAVCLTSVANANVTLTDDASVADAVVLIYDPADGNFSMEATGALSITTIEIKSPSLFLPDNVIDDVILPPFDVASPEKLFTLKTSGTQAINFGAVLPPGLSPASLMESLSVNGSILPQGGLDDAVGGGPYLYVVPEPSSIALIVLGMLGLVCRRR